MNMNLNNKQSFFLNFIKIFVFVFVLTVAVNVSAQSSWTPPSSDPPGGNTPAPINESVNAQIKQGPLAIWNKIRALGGIFFPISINDLSGGGGVGFNILSSTNVLDIIGSGVAPDRKVKIWDDLEVEGDTNIGGDITIEGNIIGGNTSQICTGNGSCLDLIEVTNISGGSKWTQQGSGDNIYRLNGNVGIGTASPSAQLHTTGNVRVAGVAAGAASTQTRLLTIDNTGLVGWKDQSSLPSSTSIVGPFTAGHVLVATGGINPAINGSGSLTWDSNNSRLNIGNPVSLDAGGGAIATPKVLIVNNDTSTAGNSFPQGLHVKNAGRGWAIFADSTGPIKNGFRVNGGFWAEGIVRFSNGNPAPNKILVSTDTNGVTAWKSLTEIIDEETTDPTGSAEYIQTNFSICSIFPGCLGKSGNNAVKHSIVITVDGPVVQMQCPSGYRVISGGAKCKADNDVIGYVVGALAFTNLGISRPVGASAWEAQCRTGVFPLGIAGFSVDLPSRIRTASIVCAKI